MRHSEADRLTRVGIAWSDESGWNQGVRGASAKFCPRTLRVLANGAAVQHSYDRTLRTTRNPVSGPQLLSDCASESGQCHQCHQCHQWTFATWRPRQWLPSSKPNSCAQAKFDASLIHNARMDDSCARRPSDSPIDSHGSLFSASRQRTQSQPAIHQLGTRQAMPLTS